MLLALALSAYILMALSDDLQFEYIPSLKDVQTELFGGGSPADENNSCEVHFIDVGQGDSAIILSDGKSILIDGGENDKGDIVVDYLKRLGVGRIDLLIATHPHSDHIGGLDTVINELSIGKILMPRLPEEQTPATRTYTELLTAIADKGLRITPAKAGNVYEFGEGRLEVLGPLADYEDLNNTSLVCKFTYAGKSFLFTGDMEEPTEKDMLRSGTDVKADVLKAGHHGSKTSTSKDFYQAVNPSVCIVSAGEGNSYGHPNKETLETFRSNGAKVYRTDYQGSITVGIAEGKLTVSCEKDGG